MIENAVRSILDEAGYRYKVGNRSFILSCPKCRKKDKLYIRRADARFVCFYCKEVDNYQGRGEYCLTDISNYSIQELRSRLYGEQVHSATPNIEIRLTDLDFLEDEEEIVSTQIVLPEQAYPPDILPITSEWALEGVQYLAKRGIPLDIAKHYDLHYSPSQRRVVFPVKQGSRLLGWQSRLIVSETYWDDEEQKQVVLPKAVTSPGFKKDQAVMFWNNLDNTEHVVISEGPVSAIKAHKCGGNICTLGKAVSRQQIEIIKSYPKIRKIYIALDPDAGKDANRVFEAFRDYEVLDMRPKEGDIGDLSFDDVKSLFDRAQPFGRNLFVYLRKDI